MSPPKTLFDKVWDRHVIAALDGGADLLAVDRTFLHDLSGTRAIRALSEEGRRVSEPGLTFASPDHAVSTAAEGRQELHRRFREIRVLVLQECADGGLVAGLDQGFGDFRADRMTDGNGHLMFQRPVADDFDQRLISKNLALGKDRIGDFDLVIGQ